MSRKDEVISGPEIVLRSDGWNSCRFCSLALPQPLDDLVKHYESVHERKVCADYIYDGVRFVEIDKDDSS